MYERAICTNVQHVRTYNMYEGTTCTKVQHVRTYNMCERTTCTNVQPVRTYRSYVRTIYVRPQPTTQKTETTQKILCGSGHPKYTPDTNMRIRSPIGMYHHSYHGQPSKEEDWEREGERPKSIEEMAAEIGATPAHKRTYVPSTQELAEQRKKKPPTCKSTAELPTLQPPPPAPPPP